MVIKIGQKEVLDVLNKNPGKYFQAKYIRQVVGGNIQTVYSILNKLAAKGDIHVDTIISKQGPPMKLYGNIKKNDFFEETVHQYKCLKAEQRFNFMPSEVLTALMTVKELKEIKEMIKDGRKE